MKKIYLFLLLFGTLNLVFAQKPASEQVYRRSALYSILVSNFETKYHKEIENVFSSIPIPEKFDNHDLSVKIITSSMKRIEEARVRSFLDSNAIARRLVGRWFNRNPKTGECDMNLITQRGLYDATYFDVELAKMSQRGYGILADAGEELIGNTFVMVNAIRYTDKQKTSKVFGTLIKVAGVAAAGVTGNTDFIDLGNNLGDLAAEIKGFAVTVTTYLYRLEWNDEIAKEFYGNYYLDKGHYDEQKRTAFEKSPAFKLSYIGSQKVSSGKTSMQGINVYDPIQMIRKVCTRAIDESIVALQRNHDEFKIKTPIFAVSPVITAKVGMKEGVSENNKYEVLEQYIDKNGKTAYKRVGIIQPIRGKIWDNRYMAVEENAIGSKLQATTFRKISGGDFYPGMLIREIKIK